MGTKLKSLIFWSLSNIIRILIDVLFFIPIKLLSIREVYFLIKKIRSTSQDDEIELLKKTVIGIRAQNPKKSITIDEPTDNYDSVLEENIFECIASNKILLNKAQRNFDINEEIKILNVLGYLYWNSDNFHDANLYWEQSKKIAQEVNDLRSIAKSNNNIGTVYDIMNKPLEAIECYQQGLTIAQEIGDMQIELVALGNLGSIYSDQNQYSKAIEYYQQSIEIARGIDDIAEVLKAKNALLDIAKKGYIKMDAKTAKFLLG